MNDTIRIIKNHRSIRSYLNKDIPEELLDQVLLAALAMPTSINGQQVSVVVVREKKTREEIARIAGGQSWIAEAPVFVVFVADFYKTSLAGKKHGKPQVIHESVEGSLVGIFDAGIAMGGAIVAAESLGLGIVPIGGIRRDPAAMVKLLDLPEYTFPVAGLVIGFPANYSEKKPRMLFDAFSHREHYARSTVEKEIGEYDLRMAEYYHKRGDKTSDWSSQIAETYMSVYYPKVFPVMKDQGFKNDK
jgi:FMN reductase [NAD(P)H]